MRSTAAQRRTVRLTGLRATPEGRVSRPVGPPRPFLCFFLIVWAIRHTGLMATYRCSRAREIIGVFLLICA